MKKSISFFLMLVAVALIAACSSDDDAIQQSSLAEITDFSLAFDGIDQEDVDYDLGTNIAVSVPFGTDLSAVVPTFALSENATISPASGQELSFVNGESKSFIVTAEDGSTKEYTVTVNMRPEVGSGSRLETYTIADLYGENSTSTYTYNEANFVEEITQEVDDFGEVSTIVSTFEYNDENQITAKNVTASNEKTVYTYEDEKIVKAEYTVEDAPVYTYEYSYNEAGDLTKQKRTNHTDDDAVDEINFVIENGNVMEENRYGEVYVATYDDKNNPFIGLYPTAYAAISAGIQAVNVNNPKSMTGADDAISYEYNEDNYPVSSSYTYFDNLATVDKSFTYLAE